MQNRKVSLCLLGLLVSLLVSFHSFPLHAETTSGSLTQDEIWSGEIFITGSVTVPSGYVLKIEPGSIIRFADGTGLYIQGHLDATGTEGASITFTSSSETPGPYSWQGITFYDSSLDTSTIEHAVIEYTQNGVYCASANPSIKNSLFSKNSIAIFLDSSSPRVSGCTIRNSGSYGIYMQDSSSSITGCVIQDSRYAGIYLDGGGSPEIANNQIIRSSSGINVYAGWWWGYDSRPIIRNNIIRGHGAHGIYVGGYCNPTIRFNTLHGNGAGVTLELSESYSAILSSNLITWNNTGIYWSSGGYTLGFNDLWGNAVDYFGLEAGATDVALDPLYADVLSDDFRLSESSPLLILGEGGEEIGAYGESGNPPLLLNPYSNEPTTEGSLTQNEIWSGEIYITGNVTVPSGYVLKIEPGSIIRFADGTGLYIQGHLDATGTEGLPITFTSSSETPGPYNRWSGITFYDSSLDTSTIEHAVIEYAQYGVYCSSANPSIKNSLFSKNSIAIFLDSSSPRVSGCTIRNGRDYGIYMQDSSPSITGCVIQDSGYYGIYLGGGSSPEIANNQIVRSGSGIYVEAWWSGSDSRPIIRNNIIRGNGSHGIYVGGPCNPTIRFNTLHGNGAGVTLQLSDGYSAILSSNLITWNNTGIYWYSGGYSLNFNDLWENAVDYFGLEAGATDVALDPLYEDVLNDDFRLSESSPLLLLGEGGEEIGAYGGSGNPPLLLNPYSNEPTTEGSLTQNEIWSGEIYITGNVTVPSGYVLKIEPGSLIRFADGTELVIEGRLDATGTEGASITFTSSSETPGPYNRWSGITFHDSSLDTSTIEHAVIEYAQYGVYSYSANPSIKNSLFSKTGIAIFNDSSSPRVSGCTIRNSGSYGIYMQDSSSSITGCVIQDSGYYGIYLGGGSSPEIANNQIVRSSSGICVVAWWGEGSRPIIRNNIIRGNGAQGIYVGGPCNPTIRFNTLHGNGAGVTLQLSDGYSAVLSSNLITWNNTGIYWYSGGYSLGFNGLWEIAVDYFGLEAGATDVAYDPLYADVLSDDFRLSESSPLLTLGEGGGQIGAYGGSGNPPLLLNPYSNVPTTEGSLTQNEIWSGEIFITGNVTVPSGYVLKIEPGSIIRFADGMGLVIEGRLDATGTEGASITFTSSSETPGPYSWRGITFYNSSLDTSTIEHAVIEGALHGVYCSSANPSIKNSLFSKTGIAIYLESSSSPISGCTIRDSEYGIYLAYSSPSITGCVIQDSGYYGIYLDGFGSPEIANNQIVRSSSGIYVEAGWGEGSRPIIRNNIIRGNSTHGIYVGWSCNPTIRFNTLHGNGAGVTLQLSEGYSAVLSSNLITWNNTGIYWYSGGYSLNFNDLWNNGTSYWGIDPGSSDLSIDPMYVYALGGDFRLAMASSALTAGENGEQLGAYGASGNPPLFMDEDTDSDGLADGWERYHFGTLDRDGTQDADGDGISDMWEYLSYTNPVSSNAPSMPLVESPVSGTEVVLLQPILTVVNSTDPDNDPIKYEFELYKDPQMTELVTSGSVSSGTGTTSFGVTNELEDNAWYTWRVRARDVLASSQWTNASFFVNTKNDPPGSFGMASPQDESEVSVLAPVLEVTNSSDVDGDAVTYTFQVYASDRFTEVAKIEGVQNGYGGSTYWQVDPSLNDDTWYFWQVTARDEHGETASTQMASFFVNTTNNAPTVPGIVTPGGGSEVAAHEIDLVVSNATDQDGDQIVYLFECDTVDTFDSAQKIVSPDVSEGMDFTCWHLSALQENTLYYWKVKASDGAAESPWNHGSFFVNLHNDAPTTPIVKNPGQGAWVNVLAPTLEVTPSVDADRDVLVYRFEVFADPDLTQIMASGVSALPSWTVAPELFDNAPYYWRSRAEDEHGAASGWTQAMSFFVNNNGFDNAPEITVTEPSQGVITNGQSVLIRWEDWDPDSNAFVDLFYATTYPATDGKPIAASIEENPDEEGDSVLWDLTTIPDGTYYIYAIIKDANNSRTSYAPGSITIDRMAPIVTAEPHGGTYTSPQLVTLSANEETTLFFTLDGTLPTTASSRYVNPVEITASTTLKVLAVDVAGNVSSVTTESYVIQGTINTRVYGAAYNCPEIASYKASLSMDVTGPASPSGSLKYYYSRTRLNLVSTAITEVAVSGNVVTVRGTGTLNGVPGASFTATVVDGSPDSFGISITKPDGKTVGYGVKAASGGNFGIENQ